MRDTIRLVLAIGILIFTAYTINLLALVGVAAWPAALLAAALLLLLFRAVVRTGR